MKFYASIAAGVCTISLDFERAQSLDSKLWILEPDLHRIFEF